MFYKENPDYPAARMLIEDNQICCLSQMCNECVNESICKPVPLPLLKQILGVNKNANNSN
jgi:hypothetical protein